MSRFVDCSVLVLVSVGGGANWRARWAKDDTHLGSLRVSKRLRMWL